MFIPRSTTDARHRKRGSSWLLIAAAASLAVAGILLVSLTVGPASASYDEQQPLGPSVGGLPHPGQAHTPYLSGASVVVSEMSGDPIALPNAGGAQGAETAGNMVFVLAAAALAVGTVVFVGSAKKGAPEAQKSENENREEGEREE